MAKTDTTTETSIEEPTEAPTTQQYFFPAYGTTITAASREDAEAKLAALLQAPPAN